MRRRHSTGGTTSHWSTAISPPHGSTPVKARYLTTARCTHRDGAGILSVPQPLSGSSWDHCEGNMLPAQSAMRTIDLYGPCTTEDRLIRRLPSMSTPPLLCSRCQRWCRQCLTSAQRQRLNAARHAAQAEDATAPVTQAALLALAPLTQAPVPVRPEAEQGLTEALQVPLSPRAAPAAGISAGVTQAQRRALGEYQHVMHAWQVRRQTDAAPGIMPIPAEQFQAPALPAVTHCVSAPAKV
jgi:hypothetical protein